MSKTNLDILKDIKRLDTTSIKGTPYNNESTSILLPSVDERIKELKESVDGIETKIALTKNRYLETKVYTVEEIEGFVNNDENIIINPGVTAKINGITPLKIYKNLNIYGGGNLILPSNISIFNIKGVDIMMDNITITLDDENDPFINNIVIDGSNKVIINNSSLLCNIEIKNSLNVKIFNSRILSETIKMDSNSRIDILTSEISVLSTGLLNITSNLPNSQTNIVLSKIENVSLNPIRLSELNSLCINSSVIKGSMILENILHVKIDSSSINDNPSSSIQNVLFILGGDIININNTDFELKSSNINILSDPGSIVSFNSNTIKSTSSLSSKIIKIGCSRVIFGGNSIEVSSFKADEDFNTVDINIYRGIDLQIIESNKIKIMNTENVNNNMNAIVIDNANLVSIEKNIIEFSNPSTAITNCIMIGNETELDNVTGYTIINNSFIFSGEVANIHSVISLSNVNKTFSNSNIQYNHVTPGLELINENNVETINCIIMNNYEL